MNLLAIDLPFTNLARPWNNLEVSNCSLVHVLALAGGFTETPPTHHDSHHNRVQAAPRPVVHTRRES